VGCWDSAAHTRKVARDAQRQISDGTHTDQSEQREDRGASGDGGARGRRKRQAPERSQRHERDQVRDALGQHDGRGPASGTPSDSKSSMDLNTSPSLPGVTLMTKPARNTRALRAHGTLTPTQRR
jgi:hypothetical protein